MDFPANLNLIEIATTCASIFFSILLIISLNNDKSNYSTLIKYIVISEAIFIFSLFIEITSINRIGLGKNIIDFADNLADYFVFYIPNIDIVSSKSLLKLNMSLFRAAKTFSMFLNVCLSLDLVLILRNPLRQVGSRLKPYFIIAIIGAVLSFASTELALATASYMKDHNYSHLLYISISIDLIIYVLFMILGLFSISMLFRRFCLSRTLIQNIKNVYVGRHFIYVIMYIVILFPYELNDFLILTTGQDHRLEYWFINIALLGLSSVFFFIRASESNLIDIIRCKSAEEINDKKTLNSIIAINMVKEFMCIVLYGLREISSEKKVRVLSEDKNDFMKQLSNNSKTLVESDFDCFKSHPITYKKIFNEEIDFQNINFHIHSDASESNQEEMRSSSTNKLITEDLSEQDAKINEYCHKVFRELRKLDDITSEIIQE